MMFLTTMLMIIHHHGDGEYGKDGDNMDGDVCEGNEDDRGTYEHGRQSTAG